MRLMTDGRTLRAAAALLAATAAFVLAAPAVGDEPDVAKEDILEGTAKVQANFVDVEGAVDGAKFVSDYILVRAAGDNPFGAALNPADESLHTQLGIPAGQGLVVSNVTAGGPAAQAGIENNDILVRLGEADLGAAAALTEALKAAGDKSTTLRLIRAGKPLEIQIKPVYQVTFGPAAPEPRRYFIGVQVDLPDDTLRAHLKDLPEGQGLVAREILRDSPALKAGLKPFDILLECGGKPLGSTDDLVSQVQGAQAKSLTLKVLRGGKTLTFDVKPELREETSQAQGNQDAVSFLYCVNRLAAAQQDANANQARAVRFLLTDPNKFARAIDAYGQVTAVPTPSPLDQRLDALAAEIASLHKSLDELKKSLKPNGPPGK